MSRQGPSGASHGSAEKVLLLDCRSTAKYDCSHNSVRIGVHSGRTWDSQQLRHREGLHVSQPYSCTSCSAAAVAAMAARALSIMAFRSAAASSSSLTAPPAGSPPLLPAASPSAGCIPACDPQLILHDRSATGGRSAAGAASGTDRSVAAISARALAKSACMSSPPGRPATAVAADPVPLLLGCDSSCCGRWPGSGSCLLQLLVWSVGAGGVAICCWACCSCALSSNTVPCC